jgi:hypothetical protein
VISFFIFNVLQKTLINNANNDIKSYSQKLKAIPNLEKVLTIQNQLKTLPQLHQNKHIVSRLFNDMLQVTPSRTFIGQVSLDTNANTIMISGTADTIATVNTFVDTLKFTKVTTNNDSSSSKLAFSDVVLTSIGRSDKTTSYTISSNFDPSLFDGSQSVKLVVPSEVTTRSVLNAPDINNLLFNGDTGKTNNQQGGQ